MDIDWDKATDTYNQRQAYANTQSPATPDQGALSVKLAPQLDLPPGVVMANPEAAQTEAQSRTNSNLITTSPPVQKWAATGDPASVAATKDDFLNLHKIGQMAGAFHPTSFTDMFHPVRDFLDEVNNSLTAADTANAGVEGALGKGDILGAIKNEGAGLMAGLNVLFSPLAVLANPAARELTTESAQRPPNIPGLTQLDAFLRDRGLGANLSTNDDKYKFFKDTVTNLLAVGIPEGTLRGAPKVAREAAGAATPNLPVPRIPGPGVNPVADTLRASVAEADAQSVSQMQDTVASSATHARSPEVMQQYLAQQPSERMVSVDPDTVLDLQHQGHDVFGAATPAVTEAALNGEPFDVPLSQYLTETAGQPFAEELNKATVFRDGGGALNDDTLTAQTPATPPPFEFSPHGDEGKQFFVTSPNLSPNLNYLFGVNEPNQLRIDNVRLEEANRGQGMGLSMYETALRTAQEHGKSLVSDQEVSVEAQRVWASLKRRGYPVERNPLAHENDKGQLITDDGSPVFKIDTKQAVTDKYLAESSRAEMERVVKAQFLEPLFKDPSAIGMTQGQFERYNARIEDAISTATDKALTRAYGQIKRERTPEFKDAVTQHSATVEQELAQRPDIQARNYLTNGRGPLGEPIEAPFKLSLSDPIALHGRDLGLPARMFSKTGISADEAADVFGYNSGADMVRNLANLTHDQGDRTIAQHMKDMVKTEAEGRARQQLGFGVDPDEMYNAASELINSPQVTDFLADELKLLGQQANLPFDKAAVKQYAVDRFNQLPVSTALNLHKLEGFVYKGGVRAEKALLKGDYAQAFIRKQQQFIHHLELAQAHKFIKEYTKSQRLWGKVAKKVAWSGVSPDALYWSKDILAQTGLAVKGNPADLQRPIGGHADLSSFIRAKNDAGADIAHAPVPRQSPTDMTVSTYRGVADMVQSIMKWGRAENQVTIGGLKKELQATVEEGIASLMRYDRTITDAEIQNPNFVQTLDKGRRMVDSWLVRQEQLLRDFGARNPESPFHQVVTRRIQERKAWAQDTRLELAKEFGELSKRNPEFGKWLKARLPTGPLTEFRSTDGSPLFATNNEVLVAALHMGDTEALDKFMRGYGITNAEGFKQAIVQQMTPEAWDVAQTIWDAFAKLKPEITAMYKRINGHSPKLVEPTPFSTPDGLELRGGYFPVMYDFNKAPKEWLQQQDANTMLGSPHYVRSTPTNNYIEQRTGFAAPMQMRFANVYARINQQIHDVAFREALADANKFLLHPDMVNAITHKYGPEYVNKLRQDLKDIAGSESFNPNDQAVGKVIDWLSEGQMIDMIGFSTSTMVKHGLTAQFQSLPEIGLQRQLSWMQKVALSPGKWTKIAEAESPEVRHVVSNLSEDAYRQFLAIQKGKPGWNKQLASFAFHLVGASNKIVAVPLFHAAKEMIAEQHPNLDEAGVISGANAILRQALGSSGPTDAPIALRFGNGLPARVMRLTNPFMTFFSHMYNKQREIPQSLGFAGENVNIGRGMGIVLATVIAPIAIEELVRRKAEDGVGLLGMLAQGIVHQEITGVPVVGPIIATAIKQFDKDYPGGDNALQSIGANAGKTIANIADSVLHGAKWTGAKTRQALMSTGVFIHNPGTAEARFERFIETVMTSGNWGEAIRELTGVNPPPTSTHTKYRRR